MSEPRVAQKRPYVKDEEAGKKQWCACGYSANQPYCDGSHRRPGLDIRPMLVNLDSPQKVAWCGCKHTKTPPYCDGSHNAMP